MVPTNDAPGAPNVEAVAPAPAGTAETGGRGARCEKLSRCVATALQDLKSAAHRDKSREWNERLKAKVEPLLTKATADVAGAPPPMVPTPDAPDAPNVEAVAPFPAASSLQGCLTYNNTDPPRTLP
jgi:hypothetical protein